MSYKQEIFVCNLIEKINILSVCEITLRSISDLGRTNFIILVGAANVRLINICYMFKVPTSHHCASFRNNVRYRISSSNLQGYGYRGSNNALRYWDVWADGVTNLTAAVEAFNNNNNISLPGSATTVTRAISELISNDKCCSTPLLFAYA